MRLEYSGTAVLLSGQTTQFVPIQEPAPVFQGPLGSDAVGTVTLGVMMERAKHIPLECEVRVAWSMVIGGRHDD